MATEDNKEQVKVEKEKVAVDKKTGEEQEERVEETAVRQKVAAAKAEERSEERQEKTESRWKYFIGDSKETSIGLYLLLAIFLWVIDLFMKFNGINIDLFFSSQILLHSL